jgi:hypothetical protein
LNEWKNRLWKILALGMIIPGAAAIIYASAAVLFSDDPLAAIFIPLVLLPALPVTFLGWLVWKEKEWAVVTLRVVLAILFIGALYLNMTIGLNVFAFRPFAVLFIGFCILWFILSFFLESGTTEPKMPDKPVVK